MGFQDIRKVETDQFYIDLAFRKATEKAAQMRGGYISESKIARSKQLEGLKVKTVRTVLSESMMDIVRNFPDLDDLHEFYRELIRTTLDWGLLKKSLGAANWAANTILVFGNEINHKINATSQPMVMNKHRREYYGRCVSILKQIRENLKYLEGARKVISQFPVVRTGIPTVAIVGFPNVGKTTLLYKLTGAKAEIKPYSFTTKGVNVGYLYREPKQKRQDTSFTAQETESKERRKVQVLDTPGTLNREDKMNNIEKVAYLALELLADRVVYVFDLSEPYPLSEQVELYERIKKLGKPLVIYLSKTDILAESVYAAFAHKMNAITTVDAAREFLLTG